MFWSKKPDVLVVGAGPVGLLTGLTLAKRDVKVQIIDEAKREAQHAYALALHPSSLSLLDRLGVLGPVLESAYRIRSVGLYDGAQRRHQIQLSNLQDDFSFVAVLRQSELEQQLANALAEHGVKVKWHHRMSRLHQRDDHVETSVGRLEVHSSGYAAAHSSLITGATKDYELDYLVGCDGCNSLVRRALDIDFPEVGPAQHFAVFEFSTDYDFGDEVRIMLDGSSQNAVWPLPGNRCRFSFELPDYDDPKMDRTKNRLLVEVGAGKFPMLTEENLKRLLAERAPWFDGTVNEIEWNLVVRFERRLAKSFGAGRVWLAGDAAHMANPVGIQSMNVGLLEGYDLAERIADAMAGPETVPRLQRYGEERLSEWKRLGAVDKTLHPREGTDRWLVAHSPEIVRGLPASGRDLDALVELLGFDWEPAS